MNLMLEVSVSTQGPKALGRGITHGREGQLENMTPSTPGLVCTHTHADTHIQTHNTFRHNTHTCAHANAHTHIVRVRDLLLGDGAYTTHTQQFVTDWRACTHHGRWLYLVFTTKRMTIHAVTQIHLLYSFFFFSWAASNAPECRNNGHKHYPLHPHWVYICCLGNGLVFFLAGSSRRILSPSAILQVNTKQWACETFIFSSGFIFSQSALGSSAFKALVLEQASRAIKRTKINMCCDLKIHGSLIFM